MMWWWDGGHWGGWIGMILMVIVWVAVVVGIIYLIRYLARRTSDGGQQRPPEGQAPAGGAPGAKPEALRILEERYARGEIDQEEFLRRKADLTS